MATWPASLPQNFALGTSDTRGPAIVRFSTDAGPGKVRRLFGNPSRRVTWPIRPLSQTQRDTLDAFFITTLREGSLPFDFKDPSTNVVRSYRFLSPPTFSSGANSLGRLYFTSLDLELLPG